MDSLAHDHVDELLGLDLGVAVHHEPNGRAGPGGLERDPVRPGPAGTAERHIVPGTHAGRPRGGRLPQVHVDVELVMDPAAG